MAVESQQVLMVESTLATKTVLAPQSKEDDDSEVSADILQQALQEATEEFDPQTHIEYDNVENAVAVVHGAPDPVEEEEEEEEEDMDAGLDESDSESNVVISYNSETTQPVTTPNSTPNAVRVFASTQPSTNLGANSETNAPAPIGSSQNPIQIIQQGNTYHSTQMLSQEQLQQIAQVLQQQQQLSQLSPNGSTSVLYNAATNTRIVYRIIYPSDLHNKGVKPSPTSSAIKVGLGRGRGRPRKPWGKRFDDVEEKAEAPELSREEKEEKKKHRPRTRSGRISKPPKYMVKDYKRIHHLDFDEDPYDDSDGGYSDYRVSGDDDDNSRSSTSSIVQPGTSTSKARKYQCTTCAKAYIGRGGLSRHYRLNPAHGNADDIEPEALASNTSMDGLLSGPATPASVGGSQASNDGLLPTNSSALPLGQKRGRGRPVGQELASARRKAKLKEIIKHCDNEELMETVMPRLTDVVSVWEFLLMKCEKGSPPRTHIPDICKELESLIKQAQQVAQDYMTFLPEASNSNNNTHYEISNTHLASTLGIPLGCYEVKEMQKPAQSQVQYKMLTTDPAEARRTLSARRIVEVVAPEEIIAPNPSKRRRLNTSTSSQDVSQSSEVDDSNLNSLPVQILQEGQEDGLDFEQFQDATEVASRDVENLDDGGGVDHQEEMESVSSEPKVSVVHDKEESNAQQTCSAVEETTFVNIANASEPSEPQEILNEFSNKNDNEAKSDKLDKTEIDQIANEECNDSDQVVLDNDNSKIMSINENSQFVTQDGQIITTLQDANGQAILGQILCQRNEDGEVVRQVMIQEGQVINGNQLEGLADLSEFPAGLISSNVVIVQNADGSTTTVQLPADHSIPLETVQALLAMDSEAQSQVLQTTQTSTEMTEEGQ